MRDLYKRTCDKTEHQHGPLPFAVWVISKTMQFGEKCRTVNEGNQGIYVVEMELDRLVELIPRDHGAYRVQSEAVSIALKRPEIPYPGSSMGIA